MWVIKNQKNHMIHHILSCNITCTSPVKGPHLVQAPEDRDVQMPPYYVKIQWEPVVKIPNFAEVVTLQLEVQQGVGCV